ncbi:tyrosine--tRNA ligase, mitochondrial isoform X2 [Cylas formicarius]|uniref:tyrosine--tRNA ligase, mitochondrial isoform X2 n=1 Tax=Cylas formicarius TaxID=197179 RepID=UPI002958CB9C|nr:tyrosine--tRNA ligase, mitochondrial isoform X2 [Cylas formicarius]
MVFCDINFPLLFCTVVNLIFGLTKFKMIIKGFNRTVYFCRFYSNRNILKIKDRGIIQDLFPDNAANIITDIMNANNQTVYAGFDPTAKSLHVGNLLVLINLLHWQRGSHNVIAVVGGATAHIGDPSGRSTEREAMSHISIEENIGGLKKNIETIFKNHEKYLWNGKDQLKPIKVLNNDDWYKQISATELIGKSGRHLRMGTLLSRSSVQTRLKSSAGMSFTEFSYQLFQAHDWLHLFETHKCCFQIGGNDQMGNIMSGHELISKVHNKPVYGLTIPLVTSEMGDKFGKSAGNAVWLDPELTSPFTFYQFWIRQPDSEVEKFLKLFTFDTVGSISDLMRRHRETPELRLPQKKLSEKMTLLVHGEEGLLKAEKAAKALYSGSVEALGEMNAEEIAKLFEGATVVEILPKAGQSILDISMEAGCFPTIQDAVRIISAGGFSINQRKVQNPSEIFNINAHMLSNKVSLFRVGKRNYYVVKLLY